MTIEELHRMAEAFPDDFVFGFPGHCHDCGAEIEPEIRMTPEGFVPSGGYVFHIPDMDFSEDSFRLKCEACWGKDPVFRNWRETEVYTRTVGYLRPVRQMSDSKQAEVADRKMFDIAGLKRRRNGIIAQA